MSTGRLTAVEAAQTLGVSRATLYAYASRGKLRSETVPGRSREHRYYREDVQRLRDHKEARRDPGKAVARGLHWGSPVLESAITLIRDGRLYYRGHDVLKLARKATLEEAAELLWEAPGGERGRLFEVQQGFRVRTASDGDPLSVFQSALPLAGRADPAAWDLRPEAMRRSGARIIRLLTAIVAGRPTSAPVHEALQAAWGPRQESAAEAIRTALVLCADHELNVSAFTARCAASAEASPYDVVCAALSTLKGRRHGGESERVAALLSEIQSPERARAVIANRLRRGERVPGFGHPLYPSGDPRAALLLRFARQSGKEAERRLLGAVVRAASRLLHEHPNLDFGLTALARAYALPASAPMVLFAVGRTAGWIAHAMEQYSSGELIRPRARYVGPAPAEN